MAQTTSKSKKPAKLPPLDATSTIADLAESKILDAFTASELAVYVRLLAATLANGHKVRVLNADLYRDQRTVKRALRKLEESGLIAVTYDKTKGSGRVIEVR